MKTITTKARGTNYSNKNLDRQILRQNSTSKFDHYMQQVILAETVKKISLENKRQSILSTSGNTTIQVYSHPATIYFTPFQGSATIY